VHVLVSKNLSNLVNIELSRSSNSPSKDVSAHLGADWPPWDFPFAESRTDASRPAERHTATCVGGAIHIAVEKGSVRIALALIQSGADPNDHCPIAGSPLSIALRIGNHRVEMVTMLLENGAEIREDCTFRCRHDIYNSSDRAFRDAPLFDCGIGIHQAEMVTMLLENGARIKEDCTSQCLHHLNTPDSLQSRIYGSSFRNMISPLFNSASEGEFVLVELLLRYDADPNVRDDQQRTPLWIAIGKCYRDIVQVLLEYGADANAIIPNCSELGCNNSCLSTAVAVEVFAPEGLEREHIISDTMRFEMAKLLLQYGAIDSRCGSCGKTALDHAMKSGNQRLVDLLHAATETTCSKMRM
jgi:ankyrin repeat protein